MSALRLKELKKKLIEIEKWIKGMTEINIRPVDNGYILTFRLRKQEEKEEVYKTYKEVKDRIAQLLEENPISIDD